ncbi:MAG: hypothetical protein NVS3B7_09010 [Candidatus Elarobacter sp.]
MALAFVLSVGAGTAYAGDKKGGAMGGSMGASTLEMKCPKGQTWVKGYKNKKTGMMVKGYCRKGHGKMM